jgi:cobalt/nickel transport system ATP-binding protein
MTKTTSQAVPSAWFNGDPLLSLDNIEFAYGDADSGARPVLDGYSMRINRGEVVSLTGPNGSGKTTLMRIINALEFPNAGQYRLGGTLVTRVLMQNQSFAKQLHQKIGFVFQNSDTQLFCPSVQEEIAFGPRQMGLSEEEIEHRVNSISSMFQLERLMDRAPYRLSGGEKKRVAIACCLSLRPELLVLDEPTDGLDEDNTWLVIRLLRALAQSGMTILISTHHSDIVEALEARRVAVFPHSKG